MYRNPALAVDAAVLRVCELSRLHLLLIRRGHDPFKGSWALPGGFVDYGEDPRDAVLRELKEETNLDGSLEDDALIEVMGNPNRDPRKHVVSVCYAIRVNDFSPLCAGDDAAEAKFFELESLVKGEIPLAFDHGNLVIHVKKWVSRYFHV